MWCGVDGAAWNWGHASYGAATYADGAYASVRATARCSHPSARTAQAAVAAGMESYLDHSMHLDGLSHKLD